MLDSKASIEDHVLSYYTALYASEDECVQSDIIQRVIPNSVSREDNAMLTNLPTMDEVKSDVFAMNAARAPGSDGYGGGFYQKIWDAIGMDVYKSVIQFFQQSWILPNLNLNL